MTEEDGEGWIDPSSEKTFFKMPNVTSAKVWFLFQKILQGTL